MERLRPRVDIRSTCLTMPAAATLPRTILDLASDLLAEICDIVNAESLVFVSPDLLQLLLAHSRFLESAHVWISKQRHYLKNSSAATIDTTHGSICDVHQVDTSSGMVAIPFFATFDSAVMMLIALHKDKAVATYVTSLTYTVSHDAQVQGANRREAALKESGNSQDSLDAWTETLKPVVATPSKREFWVRQLLDRDNGE